MTWTHAGLRAFLSPDLLSENLEAVVQEIERLQTGYGMFVAEHEEKILQGDVFAEVPCMTRQGGEISVLPKKVILISNSCDASQDNQRLLPLDLTVAPVMRLSRYRELLQAAGAGEDKVTDIIRATTRQEITYRLYLRSGGRLEEDSVAFLDKVQSMPYSEFASSTPRRLAVLSARGFLLFLTKLSMHFLRPHENVQRTIA